MENYEISKRLDNYLTRLKELKTAVEIDELENQIKNDENLMIDSSFYSDMSKAQKVLKRVKENKTIVAIFQNLLELVDELDLCFEMHKSNEANLEKEIEDLISNIDVKLNEFEIKMLLSKEYDNCDAIVELHPGAGGTESQDWAEMLYRMYRRYAEQHQYSIDVTDYLEGEEAGIKSVTFVVSGPKAYGYLKGEQGVHRLVRISPFDSNSRRHTSFCSCSVTPVVDNDIQIEIKPEEIRIDTYRSSGAGGQHVNTTDSAVRITHFKTGIVVTCQNQRSQLQNKEQAMLILKSKLYQLEVEEQEKKMKNVIGENLANSFGSQIRSYVFHPYSMVKDHRTNYEEFNTTSIMDGEIDGFINAYLKSPYNAR